MRLQYEGESPPHPNPAQRIAMQAWAMLCTKQGSIDWAGLPIVVALLGVQNIEELVRDLMTIKHYSPEPEAT